MANERRAGARGYAYCSIWRNTPEWMLKLAPNLQGVRIASYCPGMFFHNLGMLGEHIKSEPSKDWVKRYADQLLKEGGRSVIRSLRTMPNKDPDAVKRKEQVIKYFESNAYRMNYPEYDRKGYYIGSGAIESAHRTVIQKRLKLAGLH